MVASARELRFKTMARDESVITSWLGYLESMISWGKKPKKRLGMGVAHGNLIHSLMKKGANKGWEPFTKH